MLRRQFLFALAGTAASVAGIGSAEAAVWLPLGSRRVGLFVDHDTIPVGAFTNFRKLRLTVTGNALYVYDMKVIYRNGAVDHIPIRWRIPQGGATRVIDLRGGDRFIRRVELWYGKMPNGRGRTMVHVFGRT